LTQLTRKDTPFAWTDKHTTAFNKLKESFDSATLLAHFDPGKPLILETDASDFAIAGILSQLSSEDILKPIAFYSRKMVPAELNYEIHNKEMLAIISCFKEWRQYMEGSFTEVLTDHRSLEYFTTTKQLNRRQARWSQFLADFHFTIKYRPETQGTKPDALTRRSDLHPMTKGSSLSPEANPQNQQVLLKPGQFLFGTGTSTILPHLQEEIRMTLPKDDDAQEIIKAMEDHPDYKFTNGILKRKGLTYVPDTQDLRLRITQDHHDSLQHGHPGRRKTYQLVLRNYWWPKMKEYIHTFVDSCDTCQRNKFRRHKPYGELKSLPIPPYPWSNISMDLIEDLPRSDDYNSILVVVDRLTKMALFIPTSTKMDAPELARLYLQHVFSKHGLPESIVSDRGSEFTSRFWRTMGTLLNIKVDFSTAYHPETDGQTERTNQTLEQYIRMYATYQQDNWNLLLPLAEFAYNNASSETTGISPFFANKGYHPRFDFNVPPGPQLSQDAQEYTVNLQELHSNLKEWIKKSQDNSAVQWSRKHLPAPTFQPGEKVLLNAEDIVTTRPSKKLSNRYLGPYEVVKQVSTHAYRLKLPSNSKIHDVFHVNKLEPYTNNTIENRTQPPPEPEIIEGEEEYEVQEILDSKINKRYKEPLRYLVRWVGYGPDADLWISPSMLKNAQDKVRSFHQKYPNKPHQ
jgi:hypothetical protein